MGKEIEVGGDPEKVKQNGHATLTKEEVLSEPVKEIIKEVQTEEGDPEIMALPVGKLTQIQTAFDDVKYSWFAVDGFRYKIGLVGLQHIKSLEIKTQAWKDANNDKMLYDLRVRYSLTRARIHSINDNETKGDDSIVNKLDENVMDQIVGQLYGPSAIDTPEMEDLLKNLLRESIGSREILETLLKSNENTKDSSMTQTQE